MARRGKVVDTSEKTIELCIKVDFGHLIVGRALLIGSTVVNVDWEDFVDLVDNFGVMCICYDGCLFIVPTEGVLVNHLCRGLSAKNF